MKKEMFWTALFVFFLTGMQFASADFFEYDDDVDVENLEGMSDVKEMMTKVISIIRYAGIGIAMIFLLITGIQFMGARDPQQKKDLGERLKYVIIGTVILLVGTSLVQILV